MPYVCFPVCEAVVWAEVLRGSSTELSPAGCLSAQQEENQTQGLVDRCMGRVQVQTGHAKAAWAGSG